VLRLGGAMMTARTLRAQQKAMPVIGFLNDGSPPSGPGPFPNRDAFRQGLGEAGYIVGQDVLTESRYAEYHYDRMPTLAADLVGRKVDVIVTGGTPGILAAKSATSTIPIHRALGFP
jgi:putative ABC transport system substrate-binding protein